jgi:hypothetical protein
LLISQKEEKEETLNSIQTVKTEICKWTKFEEDEKQIDLYSCSEKMMKKYSSVLKGLKKALSTNYKVFLLDVDNNSIVFLCLARIGGERNYYLQDSRLVSLGGKQGRENFS